jgi:hypothetical protein
MKISEAGKKLTMNPRGLSRAEELLLRYPAIDATERDEIGLFLRRAAPMDRGILSTNEVAWRNSESFKIDHPAYFGISKRELTVMAVMATVVILILYSLWDIGLGG